MPKKEQQFKKSLDKCLHLLSNLKNESFLLIPQAYCLSAFVLLLEAKKKLEIEIEEQINENNERI
jgi:hypothetical protein